MGEWFEKVTFGEMLDRVARRFGEREALVFGEQRWTFAQLKADCDRAARGLIRCGIAPGDKVALWLPNRPEWIHILFAVAKIGAVLVPINTRFRTADLEYVLRQSDSTTLITTDHSGPVGYLEMVRALIPELDACPDPQALRTAAFPELRRVIVVSEQAYPGTLRWRDVVAAAAAVDEAELFARQQAVDPDGTVLIMYTSGTTGFPKGVMHCHNILRNITDEANRLAVRPRDVILMYLPLFHAFGLYEGPLMSVVTGARQVLMAHFDAGEALRLIERERVTLIHGFDTHFHDLMAHPACAHTDRSSLRTGILAAGLSSSEPVARRAQRLLCPTVSGWGMTEVGVGAALGFLTDSEDDRCLASGAPLPGYEFKVIDPQSGQPVPYGTPGELCCRGYGVMQGYYKKPEETAKVIDAEGWLHSGDMAVMREDETIRFLGRYKDMLKVGGENVDPIEVEALLLQHPAVAQAQVVGVPDPRLSEVPCACVVLAPGAHVTAEELIAFCRGKIASFKIPRHVLFMKRFPMTSSGKVQKFKLRELSVKELGLS
ncbi:MAG: AMP-binding protein [Candidatus Tectimicrobiota bacterium]|nr:MAG: AMP-binding protein [Candidatus Tectomicrobia bacterium]